MSRGVLNYVLQIFTFHSKEFLNDLYKVVDKTLTFLLCNSLNLSINYCFQSSNCVGLLIGVVLEKPPQEEIWGIQLRQLKYPFQSSLVANETFPKLFMKPGHGDISSVERSTILLELLFFSSRSSHFLSFAQNCWSSAMCHYFITDTALV